MDIDDDDDTWNFGIFSLLLFTPSSSSSSSFHRVASSGDRCPSGPPLLSPDNPPRADRSLEADHTNPTESHYQYPDAAGRTSAASPVTAFLHFKSLRDTLTMSLGLSLLVLYSSHWA